MVGNDPDAALYWLATMVAADEDPKCIARRIIIAASEDVGNADPRALQVAVAAAQALDWVGMPEGQYALAQATAYVATAPKSNRAGQAYWKAAADVQEHGSPVPKHLLNAPHRGMRSHGIGVGYKLPHEFEGADVDQQYLPDALIGRRYYEPSEQGWEQRIGSAWMRWWKPGGEPGASRSSHCRSLVLIQSKETGKGAVVQLVRATNLPSGIWPMVDDPPGGGPCTDTVMGADPLVGMGSFVAKDNDVFGSGRALVVRLAVTTGTARS